MSMNEKAFPLPLEVKFLDGNLWELLKPFKYINPKFTDYTVPAGFKFDFASIPKILWSIVGSPTGPYGPAALIHDHACFEKKIPRSVADKMFLHSMKDCGVNWFKRWYMYRAVRGMSTWIAFKGWFKK